MLPMIAYHPKNIGNFVGKTGKQEMQKDTNSSEFPKQGSRFSNPNVNVSVF